MVLRPQPSRPLTAPQKAFNKLIRKIERLRSDLDALRRQLDEALSFHGKEVHPRLQRLTSIQKELVRELAPFLSDTRLKRKDKSVLADLIAEHLDAIVARGTEVDDDLRLLFERIHGTGLDAVEREQMDAARSAMEEMFGEFGLDVDLSGLDAGMSDEEVAARLAEVSEQVQRQAEKVRDQENAGRKTRRQMKEEERFRQAEALRKKSVGSIYRELAKVLHPDLEQDPEVRKQKSALMQELTTAYASNDLHTLLRLELEWIQREQADLTHLTDAKLSAYNQLLREQVGELEFALEELPFHPRYEPLVDLDDPFGPNVRTDGRARARQLDHSIDQLGGFLARLRSGDALQLVRRAVDAYRGKI